MHCDTSSDGLRVLAEDLLVDLVHGCKIFHVCKEDINLDRVVDVRACCFKDSGEVGEALCLCLLVTVLALNFDFICIVQEM